MTSAAGFHIHDDNASEQDLLGFDAVVQPIVRAISRENVRPLTIGLRGDWGSGKSTLLNLIGAQLSNPPFLVITVDPWEYEAADQMRAAVIESVLLTLGENVPKDGEARTSVKRLLARVRFGKIATSLFKGAATMPFDMGLGMAKQLARGLVASVEDFVTEPQGDEQVIPADMRGFRTEFSDLIKEVQSEAKIRKVVVLVDDLDRCLPTTVVETLEAIKLFMSVEHMVFVIAADETMVRSALAAHITSTGQGTDDDYGRFAGQYLEKIIQLPFSIPFLTETQAVAYATMLLCAAEGDQELYESLVEHCRERRSKGQDALEGFSDQSRIEAAHALAYQVCTGMSADRRLRPRQIKRFLNSLAIRRDVAAARNITALGAQPMAKLLLLEEEHQSSFIHLVETDPLSRSDLLTRWESWAHGEKDATKPDRVSDASRRWAATEPSLASEDIDAYLTLAASLATQVTAGIIDEAVSKTIRQLLSGSEADFNTAAATVVPALTESQARAVLREIPKRASVVSAGSVVSALVAIAEARDDIRSDAVAVIEQDFASRITVKNAAELALSKCAEIADLATRLVTHLDVPPNVQSTIRDLLVEKA